MNGRKLRILTETVQKLLRRGAVANIQKMLSRIHPADIAVLFRHLSQSERVNLFRLVRNVDKRAELVSELDAELRADFLQSIGIDEALKALERMSADDVADVLRNVPDEFGSELLARMHKDDSLQVEGILRYAADTAGGIMVPDFFALPQETTAEDAIGRLRAAVDLEMAFYVYVVNEFEHLVGVVSLRQLVIASPNTRLSSIMESNVVRVRVDTDQEEVAALVSRYNYLAIPVVDTSNKLVGIVTVDDVIDVLHEEATEDILRMAGSAEDITESRSLWRGVKTRLPWVGVAFLSGVAAMFILQTFVDLSSGALGLLLFLPMVLGLGANVGIQSSTLIVRGLATGLLAEGRGRGFAAREVGVGIALAVLYGMLAGVGAILHFDPAHGWIVGVAITLAMVGATLVGAIAPFLMAKVHLDPALATGPVVRGVVDLLGIVIYFAVANPLFTTSTGG
ncbi:MAG: magnesium transporter [Myxococcales bacterium]|nr:magnesium transporter [Myxococcales bacterium]